MSEMPVKSQSSLMKYIVVGVAFAVTCVCLGALAFGGYSLLQGGKIALPAFGPSATPTFTASPVFTLASSSKITSTPTLTLSTLTFTPLPTETATPENTPTPVVTQSFSDMAEMVAVVLRGEGVPGAAEYDKNKPGPHRIILLTADGEKHDWNDFLRPEWVPTQIGEIELVGSITYFQTVVATQRYTGCGVSGPIFISRIRRDLRILLQEAKTGKNVSSETFEGSDPPGFDWSTKCSTTAFYGDGVPYSTVNEWLRGFISP